MQQDREFTLADLEVARQELKRALEKGPHHIGAPYPNRPCPHVDRADRQVLTITRALQAAGKLELTPREKLTVELNQAYPCASNRTIVTHKGRRYMKRVAPSHTSRSGKTVYDWHGWWEDCENIPSEDLAQTILNELHPGAAAGTVAMHEGQLHCLRRYHWNNGRTTLWWKNVESLSEQERTRHRLNFNFPDAREGDVVSLEGASFRRGLSTRGPFWRRIKGS